MIEQAREERNAAMAQQCFPAFHAALAATISQLEGQGYRPRIQCAWRSEADQLAAFENGHSHVEFGFHNCTSPTGVPESLAADVLDDDHPLNPSRGYVMAFARLARRNGLRTGVLWDLPTNVRTALDTAIDSGDAWTGKIGFDPTHVEWVGLSIEQARAGLRPSGPELGNA